MQYYLREKYITFHVVKDNLITKTPLVLVYPLILEEAQK